MRLAVATTILIASLLAPRVPASAADERYFPPTDSKVLDKLEGWQDAKFGLMMHWGTYSQWGVVESWALCGEDEGWCKRTIENYDDHRRAYENLATTFNPTDFNPTRWADAARAAGMRYVVFTTKHHDGFCMFDTKATAYRITGPDVPFHTNKNADVTLAIFDAFRAQDFMIGAYYSKPDWHSDDYWWQRFPTPDRHVNYDVTRHPDRWERFVRFTHTQIDELMSRYGRIDILWLDGGWVRSYTDKELTEARSDPENAGRRLQNEDIRIGEIARAARAKQPGLIVVDRAVEGPYQDYLTPENRIPEKMIPHPWESNIVSGDSYSYKPGATYLSSRAVVQMLADIVAKGGNMLLNIAPSPKGDFDPAAYEMLAGVADWMKVNSEAIYDSRPIAPYRDDRIALTRNRHTGAVYAIYLSDEDQRQPPSDIRLDNVAPAPGATVTMLGDSQPLEWKPVGDGCGITIPERLIDAPPCGHTWVLKISKTRESPMPQDGTAFDATRPISVRVAALLGRMTLDEKLSQLMHASPEIERLGIPPCNWWNECLHGVARAGRATVFPQAIGLAATFDEDLIREIGNAIGVEARAKYELSKSTNPGAQYAGLTFWSPNINIFRDPRWGRGQETYGEDPYLTGRIGAAYVRGLQGDRPPYLQVAACAKHFAAHSGPENGRDSFDSVVSPKDLNETYLPAFHALVDAGVAGVMCAYNRVDGRPCCGDSPLLNDVLRNKWGFDGYVVSDCGALNDIHANHKVTTSAVESAAMALRGGVDLNCGGVFGSLNEALDKKLVTEADVDRAMTHLLTIRMRLGEFDPPHSHPYAETNPTSIACPEHIALARRAATESIVLLKNANQTLPLKQNLNSLYVTGPNAASIDVLLGNYRGISGDMKTILEGVVSAVAPSCRLHYNPGCLLNTPNANDSNLVAYQAAGADAVIAVLGTSPLMEGESGDSIASVDGGDRTDLGLPANQLDLLKRLREATKQPLIVVLTGGSPIIAPEVHELADAILFVWYPGEVGGDALADVLFGDVAPSGRLPITFPASLASLPAYEDYSMRGRTYRFATAEPLYPFGFGLTYAELKYSDLLLDTTTVAAGNQLDIRFKLQNRGERPVDEVVQIYLSALDVVPDAPRWSLCAFQRVRIHAMETLTLRQSIPADAMSTVDVSGRRTIRAGRYRLTIGGASPGLRSAELGAPSPQTAEFEIIAHEN